MPLIPKSAFVPPARISIVLSLRNAFGYSPLAARTLAAKSAVKPTTDARVLARQYDTERSASAMPVAAPRSWLDRAWRIRRVSTSIKAQTCRGSGDQSGQAHGASVIMTKLLANRPRLMPTVSMRVANEVDRRGAQSWQTRLSLLTALLDMESTMHCRAKQQITTHLFVLAIPSSKAQ